MQRKDQNFVTEQLYQYLLAQNRTDDFLQSLVEEGYCYSFSLCRAAMRITGKLNWWEAARDTIVAWDGEVSSLNNAVILPGADGNESISLQTIFERFIHYIVFNQASNKKYPHADLSQRLFLRPGGPFLVLQSNDEPLRIKKNYLIAGLNSAEDLAQSLQDEITIAAIENNICLVNSSSHSCELSYLDGVWYFYDPDYLDGKAKPFTSIVALVEEIRSILGQDLLIELASMRDNISNIPSQRDTTDLPFSYYYNELLDKHPEKLLQQVGFPSILMCPPLIPRFLKNLKKVNKIGYLNPNQIDSDGWTPLIYAAEENHSHAIKALCDAGANPNHAMSNGATVLMYTASKDHADAIKALCDAGADPNQAMPNDTTVLMYTASKGHVEAIKALCDAGANPNHAHPCGCIPLMLAAQNGHLEAVKILLDRTDLTIAMSADVSVLINHATNQNRHQEIETLFKSQHNNILPTTIAGFTALHLATFFGHTQIVSILLNKMTSLRLDTLENICQIAQAMNYLEIVDLLQSRVKEIKKNAKTFSQRKGFILFECKDKQPVNDRQLVIEEHAFSRHA